LRRDGQKIGAEGLSFTGSLLESVQLYITVRSPLAPIKRENQGSAGKKIF